VTWVYPPKFMMRIPAATYRLQFSSVFTFDAACDIVPYLDALGVSDLYASPILCARRGSSHGYDVADHSKINPELGGEQGFDRLADTLRQHDFGWVQDIVPNHMAYDGQNPILMDVLENGPKSRYHNFFDINWDHLYEGIRGRVLAPFLGKFYGDCLESGELTVQYVESGLTVNYYDLRFPLCIESYGTLLSYGLERLRDKLGRTNPTFVKFLGVLYTLRNVLSEEETQERYDQIYFIKAMLWELWNESPEVRQFIEENLETFNGVPGNPESYDLLEDLLDNQYFRLAFWKVGNEELNYRRFFTVNDLISLNVENPQVFEATHQLILKLVGEQKITGLRLDHIDGLCDPAAYLTRLRESASDAYILVEKILEMHEELPLSWPIQGTTGYDFLNYLNGLFCQEAHREAFDNLYARFIGHMPSPAELIDEKKRLIISKHLAGDIDNLAHLLKRISGRYRYASDFTIYGLKTALVEIMAVFPVYRTYINERDGLSKADRDCIQQVIDRAKQNIPIALNELAFIERFLLLDLDEHLTDEDRKQWLYFVMRLQQFTGPLMAKGVEDTVLYIYNRLVSLNEVGTSVTEFGVSLDRFHTFNHSRAANWPHAMSASATHDTKRGEDVRARINVLSEMPDVWEEQIKRWREINAAAKDCVNGIDVPDANDEYFLYQTLIGTFPFTADLEGEEYQTYIRRVKEYLVKAIREAKVHTAWLRADTNYEEAFMNFAERLLKDTGEGSFLAHFLPFQRQIQHYGVFNSLAQLTLKLTCPGVPDIYQGTELWDLSLVDPDNRRPVDFDRRSTLLQQLQARMRDQLLELLAELLSQPEDGRIKLFLLHRLLQSRRQHLDLFQRGDYQRLVVIGSLQEHVVAFARTTGSDQAIVVVPRLLSHLISPGEIPISEQVWHETRISLPSEFGKTWQNLITDKTISAEDTLWVREVFQDFPVALLVSRSDD